MRTLLFARLVVLLPALFLAAPALAQTQAQMTSEACAGYKAIDARLDAIYHQVLETHKAEKAFVAKLRKAQRAWIAFRDAELDAIYPAARKKAEYGSDYPMCDCLQRTTLTQRRIDQLAQWLSPAEGDVCRGSR